MLVTLGGVPVGVNLRAFDNEVYICLRMFVRRYGL